MLRGFLYLHLWLQPQKNTPVREWVQSLCNESQQHRLGKSMYFYYKGEIEETNN